jgi:hypothetical protein
MKTLGSNAATALASDAVKACAFVQFEFTSGTHRYTTLPYTTTWNGNDWFGLGNLVELSEVRETEALTAVGVKATLSGVPASFVSLALSEPIQSKPCTIWFAALGSDNSVLDTPPVEFKGSVDNPDIVISGGTCSITINIESALADFARPKVRRYNDADQQAEYPGDLFFQFVPQMIERTIIWPARQWFKDNA